jgi:alkylation response protein AidB-like acyl-CoA dehydrogenase
MVPDPLVKTNPERWAGHRREQRCTPMKLELAPADARFEAEIRAFVRTHWQTEVSAIGRTEGLHAELDGAPWTPALRRWFDALTAEGWSVPYWPVNRGGTDWGSVRRYLFQRVLADAGAPLPINCATGIVGPLLLNEPVSDLGTYRLEQIRRFEVRWSIAAAEPESAGEPSVVGNNGTNCTTATPVGMGFLLRGRKTWVTGGLHADLLLCRAVIAGNNGAGWFVVPTDTTGVRREALPLMGSQHALARFYFEDVHLSRQDLLSADATLPLPVPPLRIRSARLRQTLVGMRASAEAADEPADRTAADSLSIQVATLEALELRGLLEPGSEEQQAGIAAVLAVRGAQIGQAVAALRARMLGYHAVPFPDDLTFHNEGVFGDETALPAVRQALFDRAFSLYAAEQPGVAASIEALKDRMAREILGFDVAG